MKKLGYFIMILAVGFVLVMGIRSCSSQNADSIFEKGISAYKEGKYDTAESCFQQFIDKNNKESDYTTDDAINNLVLTKLQLGKNADALELASDLVERNSVDVDASTKEIQTSYGYVINFLVAAHANQLSKDASFSGCSDVSLSSLVDDLEELADEKPGDFVQFMIALVYNEQYMEMESIDNPNELVSISDTLDDLDSEDYNTYQQYDDDIEDLKDYLSAKIFSLSQDSSNSTEPSESLKPSESTSSSERG